MVPDHWTPSVNVTRWKHENRGLDIASIEGNGNSFDRLGNHLGARGDPSQVAKFKLFTMRSHDALPCISPSSTNTKFELFVRLCPSSSKVCVRMILSDDTFDRTSFDLPLHLVQALLECVFAVIETFVTEDS